MTQTNLSLKKLKGIKPKGIKTKTVSLTEKIIQASEQFVEQFKDETFRGENSEQTRDEVYYECLNYLRSDLIKFPKFDKRHVDDFIYAAANQDLNMIQSQLLGTFSSCLLHVLTERYQKENQKASFCFDGTNNEFKYLFWRCKLIDELLVENFKGDHICSHIDNANILINRSLKDPSNLALAGSKGNIDLIWAIDVSGSGMGGIASGQGHAGVVIANHIFNNPANWGMCITNVGGNGRADLVIGKNMDGFAPFGLSGANGSVGLMYLDDLKDTQPFMSTAHIDYYFIHTVLCSTLEEKKYANTIHSGHLSHEELVCRAEDQNRFNSLTAQYKLNEILNFTSDKAKTKPADQLMKDTRQIRSIDNQIKPELDKLQDKRDRSLPPGAHKRK